MSKLSDQEFNEIMESIKKIRLDVFNGEDEKYGPGQTVDDGAYKKSSGLDLRNKNLGAASDEQLREIFSELNRNQTMVTLFLKDNNLNDHQVGIICKILATHTSKHLVNLIGIDFSNSSESESANNITETGVSHIIEMCKKNKNIRSISLSNNKNIDDKAVKKLCEYFRKSASNIRRLNLSGCKISDSGVKELAEVLLTKKNLVQLDISENYYSIDAVDHLIKKAENNTSLLSLEFDYFPNRRRFLSIHGLQAEEEYEVAAVESSLRSEELCNKLLKIPNLIQSRHFENNELSVKFQEKLKYEFANRINNRHRLFENFYNTFFRFGSKQVERMSSTDLLTKEYCALIRAVELVGIDNMISMFESTRFRDTIFKKYGWRFADQRMSEREIEAHFNSSIDSILKSFERRKDIVYKKYQGTKEWHEVNDRAIALLRTADTELKTGLISETTKAITYFSLLPKDIENQVIKVLNSNLKSYDVVLQSIVMRPFTYLSIPESQKNIVDRNHKLMFEKVEELLLRFGIYFEPEDGNKKPKDGNKKPKDENEEPKNFVVHITPEKLKTLFKNEEIHKIFHQAPSEIWKKFLRINSCNPKDAAMWDLFIDYINGEKEIRGQKGFILTNYEWTFWTGFFIKDGAVREESIQPILFSTKSVETALEPLAKDLDDLSVAKNNNQEITFKFDDVLKEYQEIVVSAMQAFVDYEILYTEKQPYERISNNPEDIKSEPTHYQHYAYISEKAKLMGIINTAFMNKIFEKRQKELTTEINKMLADNERFLKQFNDLGIRDKEQELNQKEEEMRANNSAINLKKTQVIPGLSEKIGVLISQNAQIENKEVNLKEELQLLEQESESDQEQILSLKKEISECNLKIKENLKTIETNQQSIRDQQEECELLKQQNSTIFSQQEESFSQLQVYLGIREDISNNERKIKEFNLQIENMKYFSSKLDRKNKLDGKDELDRKNESGLKRKLEKINFNVY